MQKIVILDRDGVINHDSDAYIKSANEWHPIEGSIEAIALLKQHGYKIAVATNQSGIARGYYNEADLDKMHQKLNELLSAYSTRIDLILFCPHQPIDACDCRKPNPSMLIKAARKLDADLSQTYFVGDTLTDYQCAQNAGAKFALVKTGKGERAINQLNTENKTLNFPYFDNLQTFTQFLLGSV